MQKEYKVQIDYVFFGLYCYLLTLMFAVVVGLAVIAIDEGSLKHINWWTILEGIVLIQLQLLILWALCLVLIIPLTITTVNSKGISGPNFWGLSKKVNWEEIIEVKPFNFIGLRYLRLYTSEKTSPIWFALFVVDYPKMVTELRPLIPDNTPIKKYLMISRYPTY